MFIGKQKNIFSRGRVNMQVSVRWRPQTEKKRNKTERERQKKTERGGQRERERNGERETDRETERERGEERGRETIKGLHKRKLNVRGKDPLLKSNSSNFKTILSSFKVLEDDKKL